MVLNMTLTVPEAMLVAYAQHMIKHHLDQGNSLIYLGVSPNLQQNFNSFVATRFSSANLSLEQQKLGPLVESLWIKTKTTIDNDLRVKQDQTAIETEESLHQEAVKQLESLRTQGITGGKIFTKRQAKLITSI